MPNKILIPLQSLISCFLEPPMNRQVTVGSVEGLWRGYSLVCPKGTNQTAQKCAGCNGLHRSLAERSSPKVRGGGRMKLPTSEVRGGGQEELPHAQGQGQWLRGINPHPRSSGCMGTGGLRGATPCSRSGGVAVRRYPSSKARSSGLFGQMECN